MNGGQVNTLKKMTKQEILDYNKRCAEFLGYVNTTPTDKDFNIYENKKGMIIGKKIYTMLETMSMQFQSDWNWVMEVVEAIEKLKFRVEIKSVSCCIYKNSVLKFSFYGIKDKSSKKEAVVQAINQFLIWYNEKTN